MGARRVVSWAYPSRIALRRFCSDMIWFRRFCGIESKALGFAPREDVEGDRERESYDDGFVGVTADVGVGVGSEGVEGVYD